MMIENNILDSEVNMQEAINQMQSFGSRTTGSKGHLAYTKWLKEKLISMGLKIQSDRYFFERWEEKRSALYIQGEELHISSVYPYSGETGEKGITAKLVCVKNGHYHKAKGKIAVIEIDVIKKMPMGLIMDKRKGFSENADIAAGDGDLVLTSVLKNPNLKKAKKMGAKAVILIWKGVSDKKAEDQYLPFTDDYMGIPAIWLNQTEGKKVVAAAKERKQATLILEAEKQEKSPTESFYVTLEGKNKSETILVNSHTDGVNVVEENGTIGMLSMIRYLMNCELERTVVFVFITGHFRLPVFKGTSQATSTWLMEHRDVWDKKYGKCKAVAGVTVEHLGSMEWKEDCEGHYHATGNMQTEYTYVGNMQTGRIWEKVLAERTQTRTVVLRGHNKIQFGESQALFEAGIPVIGLIQMPDYLMAGSQSMEMEKFSVHLMREQVKSLLEAILILDKSTEKQLGKSDGYSFLFGNIR